MSLLCVCIEGRGLRSASGDRTSGIHPMYKTSKKKVAESCTLEAQELVAAKIGQKKSKNSKSQLENNCTKSEKEPRQSRLKKHVMKILCNCLFNYLPSVIS